MQDKQVAYCNMLIASESYISTLDELKGTELYAGDIKVLVNQLLNKLQSKFKKQFTAMFSEQNSELVFNLSKGYEKFNDLALNEKALLVNMVELYKEDREFWQENVAYQFEKLNSK